MEVSVQGNRMLGDVRSLVKLQSTQFREIYGHTSGIILTNKLQNIFKQKNEEMYIVL